MINQYLPANEETPYCNYDKVYKPLAVRAPALPSSIKKINPNIPEDFINQKGYTCKYNCAKGSVAFAINQDTQTVCIPSTMLTANTSKKENIYIWGLGINSIVFFIWLLILSIIVIGLTLS